MDHRTLFRVSLNRAVNTLRAYGDLALVHQAQLRRPRAGVRSGPILLITTAFPPATWGGVFRPLSFSTMFAENGWDIVVMTQSESDTSRPGSFAHHERMDNGVHVIRLPSLMRKVFKPLFPSTDGSLSEAYTNARFAFNRFASDAPSLVLASGPAFDNFTLARHVAKYFTVPLVLDYRDDWSDCPFEFVQVGKNDAWFERRALEAAEVAVFVTESARRRNAETFGPVTRRVLIPNGFDRTVFPGPIPRRSPQARNDGKFVVAYTGSLESHVEPIAFIETVAEARARSEDFGRRIVFEITGRTSADVVTEIDRRGLRDMIRCNPPVTHDRIPDVLRGADALMIPNPPALSGALPGKFFEYMSTELPIWVFGTEGEVPDVVRRTDAGVLSAWADPDDMLAKARMLIQPDAGPFTSDARSNWALDHTRNRSAEQMMMLVAGILGRRRSVSEGRNPTDSHRR